MGINCPWVTIKYTIYMYWQSRILLNRILLKRGCKIFWIIWKICVTSSKQLKSFILLLVIRVYYYRIATRIIYIYIYIYIYIHSIERLNKFYYIILLLNVGNYTIIINIINININTFFLMASMHRKSTFQNYFHRFMII